MIYYCMKAECFSRRGSDTSPKSQEWKEKCHHRLFARSELLTSSRPTKSARLSLLGKPSFFEMNFLKLGIVKFPMCVAGCQSSGGKLLDEVIYVQQHQRDAAFR